MREVASAEGVAKLCETGNSCSALNLSALLTTVAFQTRSSSSVAHDSVDIRTMFSPLANMTTFLGGTLGVGGVVTRYCLRQRIDCTCTFSLLFIVFLLFFLSLILFVLSV